MSYPSRKIWRIRACTHQRPQRNKLNTPYPKRLNTPYSKYGINIIFWKISSVVPTPRNPQYAISNTWIRRDLDNSTSNVLIPLDSWTSRLLVYKLLLGLKDFKMILIITTAQGEYEMWKLMIGSKNFKYKLTLWDVIENGNLFKPVARTTTNADGTSTSLILGPVTADEKTQKKNDVKARSMLLMALSNEHLLTFHSVQGCQDFVSDIQTRIGVKMLQRSLRRLF
ncbi:hypothetical protein Tco_0162624 [Tanacetum coccineum]